MSDRPQPPSGGDPSTPRGDGSSPSPGGQPPAPRRGGIFEPEVDEALRSRMSTPSSVTREMLLERLPKPPPEPSVVWTPLGILGAALLALTGLGLVGVMALGLPLSMIGGKIAIVIPIVAIVLLMRGRR